MALFQPILGRVSGALAGVVFARGPGGDTIRQRVSPVNPATTYQQAVRNAVNVLTNRWAGLSAAKRDGWATYALNVPVPGRFGSPINLPALAHYVRSNVTRIQTIGSSAIVDDAPTTYNLGDFLSPTFSLLDYSTPAVTMTFDNTDAWANEDDAALVLYCARPKDLTTNFFKGPYRFFDRTDGDAVTAPTSPKVLTPSFVGGADDRLFLFARVTRADGRLSPSQRYVVDP